VLFENVDYQNGAGLFSRSGSRAAAMYANSGMDWMSRGRLPVAFYDVADGDRLVSALDRASGQP